VTAEVIAAAKKLRFIGRAGTGVDNIDLGAASRHGIVVANVPGGNTISAAEQTLALLFAMARNTPQADASTHAGKWERAKFIGTEITGKTLGVMGLGRIGREVAVRGIGLAMRVVAFDPMGDESWCRRAGVTLCHVGRTVGPIGFHHGARAFKRPNPGSFEQGHPGQNQAGRAGDQLRPGRHCGRKGPDRIH
jgi:phosphoglycerate dehydrogenase-like enzyme